MYGRKSWEPHRGESETKRTRGDWKCFVSVRELGEFLLCDSKRDTNPRASPRVQGNLTASCNCYPVVGAVKDGLGRHFVGTWRCEAIPPGFTFCNHLHWFSRPTCPSRFCRWWWDSQRVCVFLKNHSERVDQCTKGPIGLSTPFSI